MNGTAPEKFIANSFYPITSLRTLQYANIGKYNLHNRWKLLAALTNSSILTLPTTLLPRVTLLQYVQKHKKFPTNIKQHCSTLTNTVDIIKNANAFIAIDIALACSKQKHWQPIPQEVLCKTKNNIFIEVGATVSTSFFNTDDGAIYISKGAIIQEGVCLRGPIYIGQNSIIKMGATIYGGTIIGNNCTIGGEVKNAIIMNNSNKAHYGYLGNSIIGEWCNLGAGTSNSNIKNNASNVTITIANKKINAGIKQGLIMGHYSKSAINTSFNTGTVVGISCNVFSNGLTPKNIPSFSWGISGEKYIFEKAIADINKWMGLKKTALNKKEITILKKLHHATI